VAGAKFAYLTGAGALLELALVSFAMHTMASRGYTPVLTPDVVKQSVVEACGFAPRGRSAHAQSYSIEETDLVLAATAEAPLAGMWAGRRLPAENMPFRQVGFSHCFRTEVGSRGAEVRGLYRLHQFSKVEMFVVSSAAQSATLLEVHVRQKTTKQTYSYTCYFALPRTCVLFTGAARGVRGNSADVRAPLSRTGDG
jgi:seryl-tRNA synthetase